MLNLARSRIPFRHAATCFLTLAAGCSSLRGASPNSASQDARAPAPTRAPQTAASEVGRTIPGTIVLEGANGSHHVPTFGSVVVWHGGRGGARSEVTVREGRFEARTEFAGGFLEVGEIELDGVACWAEQTWDDGSLPERLDLIAHPVKPAFVRFVDAVSGLDLPDVRLVRSQGGDDELEAAPVLVARATPIEVPLFGGRDDFPRGWIGLRDYTVIVPGHARTKVWIDPSEGGTRTFELAREARLEVRIDAGLDSSAQRRILLQHPASNEWRWSKPNPFARPSGEPREPADRAQLVAHFDGLAPGKWSVMIVEGAQFSVDELPPIDVELVAGELAVAEFSSVRQRTAERTPFGSAESTRAERSTAEMRGTLRVPRGTAREHIVLRFEHGETLPPSAPSPEPVTGDLLIPDSKDPELWHWYAGRAGVGAWTASIQALAFRAEFEHEDGTPVALTLEPAQTTPAPRALDPGVAHVRFVDARTRRALGQTDISVSSESDKSSVIAAPDGTTWVVRISGASTIVTVHKFSEPRDTWSLEVVPLEGTRTVELFPHPRIEVRVYDEDARIAAPEVYAMSPRVQGVGHGGVGFSPSATAWRVNRYDVLVPAAGRFRVTLDADARYAPHPPIELEVKASEPPPVATFRLQRAKR